MKNGLLFITNCKQNGKNHNQWRIIFNHLSCKQLNLYGSKVGRWRICFALFKIYIQDQKRCIEKVRRISKIILFHKPQEEWKKTSWFDFQRQKQHSEIQQRIKTSDWSLLVWIWSGCCFDRLDWDFYFWFLIVYILGNGWQNNQRRKILR